MNKVRGYTLIDVLFAMVFIVTVVSMTTMGYTFLMRNSNQFAKTKMSVLEVGNKNQLMYSDIWRADSILLNPTGFSTFRDTVKVDYTFEEKAMRAQAGRVDTLPYEVIDADLEEDLFRTDLKVLGEIFTLTVRSKINRADAVNKHMESLGN